MNDLHSALVAVSLVENEPRRRPRPTIATRPGIGSRIVALVRANARRRPEPATAKA